MKKDEKRVDHHFRRFEEDRELLNKHAGVGLKAVRLAKSAAYRMAQSYIAMQQKDHNRLVDLIQTTYGKTPDAIDHWLAASFQGLTAIGGDARQLITAIQEGMTRQQYLSSTPSIFLNSKKRAAQPITTRPPLPSDPAEELPLDEQVKQLRLQNEALKRQLKEERGARQQAERSLAKVETEVKRLQRIMEAVPA
ncbi:MAG: hypothetical protein ACYTBJ_26600 [Planctomycetota bacterium]|jgi:hypothetical protein